MMNEQRDDMSSRVLSTDVLGFGEGEDGMDSFLNAAPRIRLVGNHEHRANLMRWV